LFDFYYRTLDNYRIKLQVWDTAGQERFRAMVIYFLLFTWRVKDFCNCLLSVSTLLCCDWGIFCWLKGILTRQVPHVEQELLTLPEHLSSHPFFCGVRVDQSLVFCVMFCKSLAIVLSLCLRFTASNYPIGIFKLFVSVILLC
jgi:hypothetical protein